MVDRDFELALTAGERINRERLFLRNPRHRNVHGQERELVQNSLDERGASRSGSPRIRRPRVTQGSPRFIEVAFEARCLFGAEPRERRENRR